jgi:transcriptional regulator with XRE-family HTH domain
MVLSETQAVYELWEEKPPVLPPHSRLYHLKPIGVGSPWVESFTSYVTRLADTHSVHPRVLITQEILPLAKTTYLYQDGRPVHDHLTTFWKKSAVLNGMALVTRSFVQALEQLTQRDDLHYLTMLSWKEVISHRKLMRRTRVWCSMCYEEWRQTGRVIYHPLLWTFECVTMCPRHGEPLQQYCPNPSCARAQPPLTPRGLPGYCMWCNRWLGGHGQTLGDALSSQEGQEWAWQRWVGSAVGELLAATPRLCAPPARSKFATAVTSYLNDTAEGCISVFARRLHVDRTNVQEWQQGVQIPQLGTLVQLCAYLETSPLRFLTGSTKEAAPVRNSPLFCKPPSTETTRRRFRKPDMTWLRSSLEEIVDKKEEPPPSMREVGQRLAYDPSVLLKFFPDLCRTISTRHMDYLHKRSTQRLQKEADEVREAVYTLHEQGTYPSQRQVQKLLRNSATMKAIHARVAWYDAMRELGFR